MRRRSLLWALAGLAAAQTAAPPLRPNRDLIATVPGGIERTWNVEMLPGETAVLQIVCKQGLSGVLSILARDGSQLVEADIDRHPLSARSLLIPPGATQIRFAAPNHGSRERIFEIHLGAPQPLTPDAQSRLEAARLQGEGERLFRAGKLDDSAQSLNKSVELWRRLADGAHQGAALLIVASIQLSKHDTTAAIATAQKAEELFRAIPDNVGIAGALNAIANANLTREQLKDAEDAAAKAIEISRAAGDGRNLVLGLDNRGGVRERQGKTDQAIADYAEAAQMAVERDDRLAESDALSYRTTLEHDLGRFQQAEEHGKRALEIAREEDDPSRMGYCLVRLSAVYASEGDLRQAIAYGEQALPLVKDPAAPYKYGNALYNVASYHLHVEDYDVALRDFSEALGILRQTGSAVGQAYTLHGLGMAYLRLGDDARADDYLRQSAAEFRKASNKQGETLELLALGGIALRRGQFAKAIELQRQALEIARAAGFKRPQEFALNDLAESYFRSRDYGAEAETAQQELDLIHTSGQPQEEMEAYALRQQGQALRRLGQLDRARDALEKSLALYQSAGPGTPGAVTLSELAMVDRDVGRLDQASQRIATALDWLDAVGAGAGNAETRMRFAAAHRQTYDFAIDLAMQQHASAKAFELSERMRARTLVDMIRGARLDIREGVDPQLLLREREAQQAINDRQERLNSLLSGSHTTAALAQAKEQMAALVEKYETVEAEIRRNSPHYAELIEPHSLSLVDLQANLPDAQTALLEFWLGEEHSYGWLVTGTECRGFQLPDRVKIESVARRAYAALTARNLTPQETPEQRAARIEASDREFARLAAELSGTLLSPMKLLPGVRRLWVVSDGALQYLPFAALPSPVTGNPLATEFAIVELPSASVEAEIRQETAKRAPASRQVAIFADPVFRADDERVRGGDTAPVSDLPRGAEDVDFATLPRLFYSRQEAAAVAALAPKGSVREELDFDASRAAATRADLADYRVVHFATHAFLDSRLPELSGLVLSMVDRGGRPQDGFLELHDIYNLKLHADLVVLSGCQTALGQEIRGEGMVGLARGFMYAGAPQVMASLWAVRDRATAEFMTHFYDALLRRRLPPEVSLREAQLAMRKDPRWQQPYFWAAFTLEGAR